MGIFQTKPDYELTDITNMSSRDKEYTNISVRNPRTHGKGSSAYTSYLLHFDSSDGVFSNQHSEARRRYSEFVWLRKHLKRRFPIDTLPTLPPKTYFRSKLNPGVVEHRKLELERFLEQVINERIFLSDVCFHLFLQTDMTVTEIENCLKKTSTRKPCELVVECVVRQDSCPLSFILESTDERSIPPLLAYSPPPPPGPALIQHVALPPSPSPGVGFSISKSPPQLQPTPGTSAGSRSAPSTPSLSSFFRISSPFTKPSTHLPTPAKPIPSSKPDSGVVADIEASGGSPEPVPVEVHHEDFDLHSVDLNNSITTECKKCYQYYQPEVC